MITVNRHQKRYEPRPRCVAVVNADILRDFRLIVEIVTCFLRN